MRREFFKRIGVNKVYVGPKSVNVNMDKEQAEQLAIGILWACRAHKRVDLAFFTGRTQKRQGGKVPQGKIIATITSAA